MSWEIRQGNSLDLLAEMEPDSVQTVITSPPYWGLRDYGHPGQLGLEATPAEYVDRMVELFRGVRKALKPDGTLWLNLGDSYASTSKGSGGASQKQTSNAGSFYDARKLILPDGLKPKDLCGIPWRVALALQADGWWLRSDIIWHKPNPMPSSVTDRPTSSHEYLFLLTRSARYYYDAEAIKEKATGSSNRNTERRFDTSYGKSRSDHAARGIPWDGSDYRNKRSVWTMPTRPFKGSHFAVMPPNLVEPCIKAGSRPGDLVLDPFSGAATVGLVARRLQRRYIGLELHADYCEMGRRRIESDAPLFNRGPG